MSVKSTKNSTKINKQGVSIVIGSRNEYPQVGMTICNLMEDCYNSGIDNFEVILMDNGSEDETSRFFHWRPVNKSGWWKYIYSPRGLVHTRKLKIFFDPVLSNVGTRNKGVLRAKYENIIFSDAHIIVRPGTVESILTALNDFGGIIHTPVSWMGADGASPKPGYQYSYKVGEKIWGTWNKLKVADTPFYIPFCGHCFIAVKKKQFLEYRGYPYAQRVYGGGEPYLDTKWWMVGSHSMCDPNSLVYHLSAGRGYSYNQSDLIHNMFLVSYVLGGNKWIDRILITYLNSSRFYAPSIKQLYEEAKMEAKEDKAWLDEHKIMTFEELLALGKPDDCTKCMKRGYPEPHAMRKWDLLNDKLHGTHRSYVQEFKLTKDKDGKIFIGRTPITNPEAIEIAKKYL